jgi:ABC-type lipoprotein release transport system permease subunit
MYQALLTRRYLLTKVMPLLASVAVLLCTTTLLITWSVMGGFLTMLVNTGRTMAGDVAISWPNTGFAYYEDLVQRLEKDPAVEAATPAIEAFGLMGLPDGRNPTVMFRGVDGPGYARVTRYADILWWRPLEKALPKDEDRNDPRLNDLGWKELYDNGLRLERADETGEVKPAVVPGVEVSGFNVRERAGFYTPRVFSRLTAAGKRIPQDTFLPRNGQVTINVLPVDSRGRVVETVSRILPVANEFHSGVYELDHRVVLVNLSVLQQMLKMDKAMRVAEPGEVSSAPATPSEEQPAFPSEGPLVEDPARVTHVLVKGKGAMERAEEAEALKARVEEIYAKFAADHRGKVPDEFSISISTWRDQNATMIAAVEKETALVLFLFCFMSLTCVFLVLSIFWSMISEKTKDIGVLRSLGASRAGVAWLWLRYGLGIGVVGSVLGGTAACLIVWNINPIHEWMGRQLGVIIWDPRIYYFVTIPNKVDWDKAGIVLAGGILSCVIGALWPAIRAANMHPVKALRFE